MGSAGAVAAEPSSRPGVTNTYARNWYRRAQRLDEWPGEAYEGTSVLAGCLVGRERKLWTGFRWAKRPAELAAGICDDTLGPAIIGVQWSQQLYDPPASGLLPADVTLDPDLGHCVLAFGYLPEPELITRDLWDTLEDLDLVHAVEQLDEPSFPLLNSWGEEWAVAGCAIAPASLVQRWFRARGEFALPEQRTKDRRGAAAVAEDRGELEPETPTNRRIRPEQESGDRTLHLRADEVIDGDRILDPPEELDSESVTVRGTPRHVTGWNGRRVTIPTTGGTFQMGAAEPVTVRRPS
jgi:hypothetical protein